MNKVWITGRLTKSVELRFTTSNVAVARFSLAVTRNFKNSEGIYDTDFIPVTLFDNIANAIDNVIIEYLDNQECDTFKERYFIWVERQKAIGRSDNTISKYESDYKRFFENDEFENMDIASITEEHICQLFKRILGCKSIPYRALKSAFGYINGVFEKSIMDKKIQHNPCKYVDLPLFKQYCAQPKPKTTEQRTLSNNEKKALLSKIRNEGSMARYAVELSLYTGMRVGELSGLKWEDIDFNKETITICRSEKYNRKKKEWYGIR